MTSCGEQSFSNSILLAFLIPSIFRANSIIMSCIQRHIPRQGILFFRIYSRVVIIFSTAVSQKPQGTIHPSHHCICLIPSVFRASIKRISICIQRRNHTWCSASTTLEYESSRPVYFHKIQIVHVWFTGSSVYFSHIEKLSHFLPSST